MGTANRNTSRPKAGLIVKAMADTANPVPTMARIFSIVAETYHTRDAALKG